MKRVMTIALIVLFLLHVAVFVGAGAASAEGGADFSSSSAAATGAATSVFYEGFEGDFPGSNWFGGDVNPDAGEDYWGHASVNYGAEAYAGNWSGWCAAVGFNSVYGDYNDSVHKYDNYMDTIMRRAFTNDLSSLDLAYLDFYAWSETESPYDYLSLEWWDDDGAAWVNANPTQQITGNSDWTRYCWQTPYMYLTSATGFGFRFQSDYSTVYEGVYLDEINLMVADVTVESDSYASTESVLPGGWFTLYYRIYNPAPFSVQCGLDAQIDDGALLFDDTAHDTVVTIPSGYSWQTRTFTVDAGVPDGLYDIDLIIWSGMPEDFTDGNRMWGGYTIGALRVDSVAPDPPVLLSPANGATINDNTPSFDWSDVTDPSGVKYSFEVDDNADFGSQVIWLTVTLSEYTAPSALADGRYYWRVESDDGAGNASLSAVWYFDVDTSVPPAATTSAATGVGTNMATLNGNLSSLGTASSVQVSFQWGLTEGYGNPTTPQAMSGTGNFDAPLSGLSPGTTYHFRAVAVGDGTAYGGDMTFATDTVPNQNPNQPSNTLPTDGAAGVSLTPTLSSSAFSDPDAGNTHAASQWQIDDNPWDYVSPAFDSGTDNTNLTSISIPSGVLTISTLYYWRVRYQDNHGAWSDWSEEVRFNTMSASTDSTPPTTPSIADDGVTTTSTSELHAVWSSSDTESGIVEYSYAIGTTAGGNDVVDWTSAGTATEKTITGLSLTAGQTYYISVEALNGQGLWSEIGSSNGITVSADEEDPEPGNGGGVPFWVWILVALGVVGLGAGGFVFWRKRKAKRA